MKIRQILLDKKGLSIPLAIAVTLVLIMLLVVISEYMRLNIITKGVRDSLPSAIISVVNDNYNDVYHGVREGYAAGYQPSGGTFSASINHGEVWKKLESLLGLQQNGNVRVKKLDSGGNKFLLSNLNVVVNNTPLAPSISNAQKFTADATIQLEVPMSFAGKVLPPLKVNLKVKAGWVTNSEKFEKPLDN